MHTLTSELSAPLKHKQWIIVSACFSLLCLESSCPNVCPLGRCERFLHNKYRKGVSVHPAEKQPSNRDFADLFETAKFGKFFLSSRTFQRLLSYLELFCPCSCCVMCGEAVTRCLSGLTANAQTTTGNLLMLFGKARKPHFLLFLSVLLQTHYIRYQQITFAGQIFISK